MLEILLLRLFVPFVDLDAPHRGRNNQVVQRTDVLDVRDEVIRVC